MESCDEAENAQQVLAKVQSQPWDLVILDITMPGRSGPDVLGDMKRLRPQLPILILSMHPEDQYGKRVLQAGASGYLKKESAPEELIRAIRTVRAGAAPSDHFLRTGSRLTYLKIRTALSTKRCPSESLRSFG